MKILVAYDVETIDPEGQKRLRKVARACQDYGQRVQNSVFECTIDGAELAALKGRLRSIIAGAKDSIRIYHLSRTQPPDVLGVQTAYDPQDVLII